MWWIFLANFLNLRAHMDLVAAAAVLLTVAPLVLFPPFRRRVESELGRLAGTVRPSFGRVLLATPVIVLAVIAVFVIPDDQPRIGPPFSLSASVGALLFFWTWRRTGCIGRYHLVAAIVSVLAVIVFSPLVVGFLFGGYEGFFTRPVMAVLVWTGLLLLVAIIDKRLLRELRGVADPTLPNPKNPYGRAPNLGDLLARLWKWFSAPQKDP